jgi:hypothetical protein
MAFEKQEKNKQFHCFWSNWTKKIPKNLPKSETFAKIGKVL